MEPEASLPCSQEPFTGPYPEPDQSNPSHPISLKSILISSTHLRLGLPSGLFPSGFPTNILYTFLFSPIRGFYYVNKLGINSEQEKGRESNSSTQKQKKSNKYTARKVLEVCRKI
jgi:hypothetical protein